MKCAICGQPAAPQAKLCVPCKAAIKRARDETVSQLEPPPIVTKSARRSRAERMEARSTPDVEARAEVASMGANVSTEASSRRGRTALILGTLFAVIALAVYLGEQRGTASTEPPDRSARTVDRAHDSGAALTGASPLDSAVDRAASAVDPVPNAASTPVTRSMPESPASTSAPASTALASRTNEQSAEGLATSPSNGGSLTTQRATAKQASASPTGSTHPAAKTLAQTGKRSAARTSKATSLPVAETLSAADAPAVLVVPAAPLMPLSLPTPRETVPPDPWQPLNDGLARCARQEFFVKLLCEQRARLRYCDGYWGQVPQCPGGVSNDHGG